MGGPPAWHRRAWARRRGVVPTFLACAALSSAAPWLAAFAGPGLPAAVPRGSPSTAAGRLRAPALRAAEVLPPGVEVLQEECFGGDCRWELTSLPNDLKETGALGIEVLRTSVTAAVLSIEEDKFAQPPVRIELPDPEKVPSPEAFVKELSAAIRRAVSTFKWKGVVGISVSSSVRSALGLADDSFTNLARKLTGVLEGSGLTPSFTHTMVHTEAAGYAEIAATGEEGGASWRQQVLVATLGENLGAVLFKAGHRVRRTGLNTMVATQWMPSALDDGPLADAWRSIGWPKPRVPGVGSEAWEDFGRLVDQYIIDLTELASPDRVVLVPTGQSGSMENFMQELTPLLTRSQALAKERGFTIESGPPPEDAIVKGAALAALVELRSVRAQLTVRQALEGAKSLNVLSPAQLRAVFDAFDLNGDGTLAETELQSALDLMGLPQDVSDVFEDVGSGISFQRFTEWWRRYVVGARVLSITSPEDLETLVRKTKDQVPAPFGDLMVCEITFSFCRACKMFTKKFEQLAAKYPDVRFVNMVGNHNRKTMGIVKTLDVKKAPAFFLYRRGTGIEEPLATWSGTNAAKFEKALEGVRAAGG